MFGLPKMLLLAQLAVLFFAGTASAQSGMCDQYSCSSPNGSNGFDCYAGTDMEPCTCGEGKTPEETGQTGFYDGKTYYEYQCCDRGDDDETIRKAEECGDFKHFPIGLLIAIIWGTICCCCICLALFCKGVAEGCKAMCGSGTKNSQVMPVNGAPVGGMVMPNASAGTMAQQQMMMQQQMAMQQQQMMMMQPQQQAGVRVVVTTNNIGQ